MVRMWTWHPWVGMSVVRGGRSTFSSSVTHLMAMSGFFAVKALASPCMRIMSLLLTVAIVSVVWAKPGMAAKSDSAPASALRRCFTELLPWLRVGICSRFGHMLTPARQLVKGRRAAARLPPRLLRQQGSCGRFIRDESVDQPASERSHDGRHLGGPHGRGDCQHSRRHRMRHAGEPPV